MAFLSSMFALASIVCLASGQYTLSVAGSSPFSVVIQSGGQTVVSNTAVLAGESNTTTTAINASNGQISNNGGQITAAMISPTIAKVEINSTYNFVGAQFGTSLTDKLYGVWEYPWDEQITNKNVSFNIMGVGNAVGVNWSNARAPFFLSSAGFGVYADTLSMGSFDFSQPGISQFIFNTSSLVYYIILPYSPNDYKSILSQYIAELSTPIELPPDSGYGPTYWSDDFETDFHGYVTNAQQNYYDVVDHLYYNQIHATAMFADRPYGTGNMSWGNFDFDPTYYPDPAGFIQNLTNWGFTFQVWAANRAFLNTQLYNDSVANDWLFPGISPIFFQGPALNLSIPSAYSYFLQKLQAFTNLGVHGYKIDRGEEGEMPVYEQNIINTLFEQICYDNMKSKWGEGNFYNFARSAVDRARSRTAIWNGDSHANWTGLHYSMASGIRAGLLGFSQWGSDTGGYVRSPNLVANQPTEELWARWMHFSAFCPMYELMLGTNHTPYYPPYSSHLVQVMKQTSNLHHSLFPYIKSYQYQATQNGLPLIRALFLEAPDDASVYETTDEYFFGQEFLVAPIHSPGGSRTVYFPQRGNVMYLEYFNKTNVYAGGTSSTVSMSVDYNPVYVVEGSIVPRGDIYQGNNKWTNPWNPYLEIEVYPSYAFPEVKFLYYNGAKQVEIVTVSCKENQTVTVQYGDLAVPSGQIELYSKGGAMTAPIEVGGGAVVFEGVESLFD